ncbi:MAG: transcriptional regulator [Elusimicrobia bacterium HGW-Elusimicrobia-1]|jgi:excisionase family DNA binding protein|nr:MAG: transcriptional regulator [Elusimicrobia bacterium HGW-Elusimicrobia-3]PKN01243.1 MAG: transcriptional regulator [Elusimicrobia bacterium HGW-Elusimicrobia-1]
MEKRLLTIDELTEYIAVPRGTIYNWVNQRKLPYVKIGRRVKFDKQDIDKIIDKRKILLR